ncbi:hypothetical protein [Wenxinia saemankumensis]|uniref:TnsA endonuclease N terminal n=1 Tax=Wenxinia saemankumensis TaxID=1447782 RepID=A0A1M6I2I2_9RHOB|nr:hypothetical protein [Wenxinia saemankumensis]SHJ28681.1 hypothetical protein SAMN05444417_3488 [Wenxinia saemankumensis]
MTANTNGPPGPLSSRGCRTVRTKTKGSVVGQMTFGELEGEGRCLQFESMLEHKVALVSLYLPGVVDVIDQVGPIEFIDAAGRRKKHTLDFNVVTVTKGGKRIRTGLVVKPLFKAERAKFRDEIERVARAAVPSFVDRVCIVTEANVCKQALLRAGQLHGARLPVPDIDAVLGSAPLSSTWTPIVDMLASLGLGPEGFAGVLRLVIRGVLLVEAPGLITMASRVMMKAR